MPDSSRKNPKTSGHLPLKSHWFHILMALSQEPRHGSGIVGSVLEQTGGKLRLWPATLYGSLEDLSRLGWIEELTEDSDFPEGESRRKRIYRLTPRGAEILGAEAERMSHLAQMALASLASGATSR